MAHGGCQAECNLFWKDEWLKPVADDPRPADVGTAHRGGCSETQLMAATRKPSGTEGDEPRYSCQATQMFTATEELPRWDVRQYGFDVVTGNQSASRVLRVVFLAQLRWVLRRLPVGQRFFKPFHDRMHERLTGRPSPSLNGRVPDGVRTPTGRLDLQPGEYVRIKSQEEIEETIDRNGRNRGLWFDHEEMALYCGRVAKVHKSVTTIIHEQTGKMLEMKEPCIMLEGVVCKSVYAWARLNCPRAIPSYWRELWLERVESDGLH
jgi:hypothetical protein